MSAAVGHHFAHPTNHFWRCLHGSQLTERLLSPSEDGTMPANYRIGLTNLVERPSAQAAELANSEFTDGVPGLLRKIVGRRPRIVCFVGKAIWESFILVKGKGKARAKQVAKKRNVKPTFIYDLQPFKVVHEAEDGIVRETLLFVVVSTSGLVAGYQLPEKIKMFSILKQRRDELLEGTLDTSSMTVIPVQSDLV
ncbi:uracil-DNA glycosylase-like protein [Fomes fomentarius]|nr:uracil-DNA glycosylase-like protein [Fomes fomentarius]